MSLEAKQRSYRDLAGRFCAVVEATSETPLAGLIAIRDVLIELYQASLNTAEICGDTFLDLPERISFEEYAEIKKRIEKKFELDLFSICYHPFKSPPEAPIWASVSDGLADIWRDLKPGLSALEEDEASWAAAVFWGWKSSFDTHWGDHAVDCVWAIHKLLRDEPPPNT